MASPVLSVGVYTKATDTHNDRLANVLAGVDVCPRTEDPRVIRRCPVTLTHASAPASGFAVETRAWQAPDGPTLRVEIATALAVSEYLVVLFNDPNTHSITVASPLYQFSVNVAVVDERYDFQTASSHHVVVARDDSTVRREIYTALASPVMRCQSNRLRTVVLYNTAYCPPQTAEFTAGDVSLTIRESHTVIGLQAVLILAALAQYSVVVAATTKHGARSTQCAEK